MKRIIMILMLFLTLTAEANNIYVNGNIGVNTFSVTAPSYKLDIGYRNPSVRIGLDFEISPGIYFKSTSSSGNTSIGDYSEGGTYGAPRRIGISNSGNIIYDDTRSRSLSFGPLITWYPINSFIEKRKVKWIDFGIYTGTGFNYCRLDTVYYMPYFKFGIELEFKIKSVDFVLQTDVQDNIPITSSRYMTEKYHGYLKNNVYVGIRYNIPVQKRESKIEVLNYISTDCCHSSDTEVKSGYRAILKLNRERSLLIMSVYM